MGAADDGDRGERRIEGNGVVLIWAPEGPGWSMPTERGFLPEWNLSVQRCRRLSEDGESLTPEPLGRWRLPSTDEVVRSLVRHGGNAGCTWSGRLGERFQRAACRLLPDKETPLWAPNRSPIYYWTADERDARRAYFVSYNGGINHQPKQWGNPRHGYRCVKAP